MDEQDLVVNVFPVTLPVHRPAKGYLRGICVAAFNAPHTTVATQRKEAPLTRRGDSRALGRTAPGHYIGWDGRPRHVVVWQQDVKA